MGIENRIDLADRFAKGLLTEIGGGIDDDLPAVEGDQGAAAGTPVPRIGGTADGTITTEHRHAGARPRPEKGDLKYCRRHEPPCLIPMFFFLRCNRRQPTGGPTGSLSG
jgi:hypothetical protein